MKQIFIEEDNQPIRMHIHASIANPNARSLLRSRIMVCRKSWILLKKLNLDFTVAFWRISRFLYMRFACDFSRPQHRSVPAPRQGLSRQITQTHRIVSLGQEMYRERISCIHACRLQKSRGTSTRRRVSSFPAFSSLSLTDT